MKISKVRILIFFAFAAVLCGLPLMKVSAQDNPITDQQIQRIKDNCLSTKSTLNQLHASDGLLRVNRGQIYESMSTMLMDGFNHRLSNNKLDNNNLVAITNSYDSTLDVFRSNYKTYEEHLSSAIGIDCLKQPVSFFDALSVASADRTRVHDVIIKLNQYVDQYQAAVSQFEKDYQGSSAGTNN